jgi:hypothetical protein
MRQRPRVCAAIVAACAASTVLAQSPAPPADARLDQFERRLNEIDRRHQAELKARDERIANLEQRLKQRPATPTPTAADVDRVKDELFRDLESRDPVTQTKRTPVSFNPDIAVISDFLGTWSNDRANDALNRFDVREVELDIRAAVHPKADAVAILSFERDVENPVFPVAGESAEGPDNAVAIEEAYLFLHDFGVPNLTAKVGRFHLRFGRQNVLHLHDLPTSDPPLVNQAFLAPEALVDSGLSLSYVIPPKLTFGQYVEAVLEIISGEGGGSESASLPGDLSVDSPAVNAHLLWNTDVGQNWNLELGGSYLWAKRSADNATDVNLFGLDATLIHRDPSGRFNNQLLQAELIYGDVSRLDASGKDHAWGAYLLAQQQVNRDWYTGVRLDYTANPNDDDQHAWAVTPYVSWYGSEFLRFRVMYQHKDGDVPAEDILYFQATWIFGAHPPHPYWSMQ